MTYREMMRRVYKGIGYPTEGPDFEARVQAAVLQTGESADTEVPDAVAEQQIPQMIAVFSVADRVPALKSALRTAAHLGLAKRNKRN